MGGGKGQMGGQGPMNGGMGGHAGRGDLPAEGGDVPRPFPADKAAPTI